MEKNIKKLIFVSFADHRYRNAMKRMEKYIESFPFTEKHFCDETNTFSKSYWRKLKPWFYRRGFGYWKWKADLVKYFFDQMSDGDIIVYSDAGIVWNHSEKALKGFQEYLNLLSMDKPILTFQEPCVEQEWTKGDLLKEVGVYDDKDICASFQLWGGCFILMKSPISEKFLNGWIALNDISKELITDKRSVIANKPGFKEHRHDQSSFSLMAKLSPHIEISWKETNVTDRSNPKAWDKLCDNPIVGMRTKEMGRPKSELIKNKLLRPWRMFLNFYFRKVKDYEISVKGYPW